MFAIRSMLPVAFLGVVLLLAVTSTSALTVEFDPCAAYNVGSQKNERAYRECRQHFAKKLARENKCDKTVVLTKDGVKTRSVCATK